MEQRTQTKTHIFSPASICFESMSKQDIAAETTEEWEFLQSSGKVDTDFTVDEPDQGSLDDYQVINHGANPTGPTDDPSISTEVDSAERSTDLYKPRQATRSHILFLPNMASRTTEKELAEFAEKLPCKAKKTFMYMSDVAYHGFVECLSTDDASKNLEFINANNLEVRGKRVLAEYSRRKSVQDRQTYENRQHSRKEHENRSGRRPPREPRRISPPTRRLAPPPRRMSPPPLRRRSRSRSPPLGYRTRSPPRPTPSRYLPPRETRHEFYRREGPPPSDYRYPPRGYEGPPPAPYRRDYEPNRAGYRGEYDRYESYPPTRDNYPEAFRGPPPPYQPHPGREAYHHPTAREPHHHPAAPVREVYPPQPYGTAPGPAAPVSHPLLSMRPTAIGTAPVASHPAMHYQYQSYR
jgi:hypothetical protein